MNSDNDDNMLHIELSLGDVIPFELVGRDRRIRSADIALYLDQRTTDRERALSMRGAAASERDRRAARRASLTIERARELGL